MKNYYINIMNNISYWVNEDKHSIAVADQLMSITEISKDKDISKKDILRAAKDFVKLVRNETIAKEKIKETKQRPNYYNYDLYDAIVRKPFELLTNEISEYTKHNDNDIEEYNNYKSFSYYNGLT